MLPAGEKAIFVPHLPEFDRMEPIYTFMLAAMALLAVTGLFIGVMNDAANFLNSAIGSKAAPVRVIMAVASVGIIVGAVTSTGMMEVARSGMFDPSRFTFRDVMILYFSVMLANIILLDVYNTMGLPTSTTVALVFCLLGAALAVSTVVITSNDEISLVEIGRYINSTRAMAILAGILLSVILAFTLGTLVMYVSRAIFSFRYHTLFRRYGALWCGISFTAIVYFALFKGLQGVMNGSALFAYIDSHLALSLFVLWILCSILLFFLQMFGVNILKLNILAGTFSLALAFAGNDLVNFIGVPLAGYSSFIDYTTNGAGASPDSFLMTSLLGPAKTPWYFLIGAGAIMVYALCTSKKAHAVIKTSVDLSRQDEGEENFGSTPMARTLVRFSMTLANGTSRIMPESTKQWINSRFRKNEAIIADGAAFDLVRASVNLVLAGLLIALGTSLKLPLSTTYVTFMVAMGTSLADRAWGRDSAVYRITGVLSVIGGWFITAGAAFTICFFVALVLHYGGNISIIALIGIAIFILIRSQVMYKKRKAKEKGNETLKQLMQTADSEEALQLMRKHTREELAKVLEYAETNFELTVTSFIHENLRGLRRAMGSTKFEKQLIKQMKRTGTVAMCRLDNNTVLEKGLYYYQGNDFASELVYSISRLCEPCLEHIDNNFNPLDAIQKGEFSDVAEDITYLIQQCRKKLENNDYQNMEEEIRRANDLNGQLSQLKRKELQRIQSQSGSIRVSMVYLTMVQEAQNVVTYIINLMKVSRKFQMETEMP